MFRRISNVVARWPVKEMCDFRVKLDPKLLRAFSNRAVWFYLFVSTLMAALTASLNPQNSAPTFGITVVDPAGLHGRVFLLREGTEKLPDFESLKAIGSIYTSSLDVHPQHWLSGFPGVTNRFDWFAIDYRGNFWIGDSALYYFSLTSDDGSRLWIDDQLMIDNDGIHPAATRFGSLRLKRGIHRMRVSYFQGPPDMLGLVLLVAKPGEEFHVFSTNEFKPPRNPEDWRDGSQPGRDAMATNPSPPMHPEVAPRDFPVTFSPNAFSVTGVAGASLRGAFYHTPRNTGGPMFQTGRVPGGSFLSETVDIPPKDIWQRFLGRHGISEPFALGLAGSFWIVEPGLYRFGLQADDGAALWVDDQLIDDDDQRPEVDNSFIETHATLKLCAGAHRLQLQFVHSSPARAGLRFEIARPGGRFKRFRSRDFSPHVNATFIPGSCPPE